MSDEEKARRKEERARTKEERARVKAERKPLIDAVKEAQAKIKANNLAFKKTQEGEVVESITKEMMGDKILLYGDRIVVKTTGFVEKEETHRLDADTQADFDESGNISAYGDTGKRGLVRGPVDAMLGSKKIVDGREYYLLLMGSDWHVTMKFPAGKGEKVRDFAQAVNVAARNAETFRENKANRLESLGREKEALLVGLKEAEDRLKAFDSDLPDHLKAGSDTKKFDSDAVAFEWTWKHTTGVIVAGLVLLAIILPDPETSNESDKPSKAAAQEASEVSDDETDCGAAPFPPCGTEGAASNEDTAPDEDSRYTTNHQLAGSSANQVQEFFGRLSFPESEPTCMTDAELEDSGLAGAGNCSYSSELDGVRYSMSATGAGGQPIVNAQFSTTNGLAEAKDLFGAMCLQLSNEEFTGDACESAVKAGLPKVALRKPVVAKLDNGNVLQLSGNPAGRAFTMDLNPNFES